MNCDVQKLKSVRRPPSAVYAEDCFIQRTKLLGSALSKINGIPFCLQYVVCVADIQLINFIVEGIH